MSKTKQKIGFAGIIAFLLILATVFLLSGGGVPNASADTGLQDKASWSDYSVGQTSAYVTHEAAFKFNTIGGFTDPIKADGFSVTVNSSGNAGWTAFSLTNAVTFAHMAPGAMANATGIVFQFGYDEGPAVFYINIWKKADLAQTAFTVADHHLAQVSLGAADGVKATISVALNGEDSSQYDIFVNNEKKTTVAASMFTNASNLYFGYASDGGNSGNIYSLTENGVTGGPLDIYKRFTINANKECTVPQLEAKHNGGFYTLPMDPTNLEVNVVPNFFAQDWMMVGFSAKPDHGSPAAANKTGFALMLRENGGKILFNLFDYTRNTEAAGGGVVPNFARAFGYTSINLKKIDSVYKLYINGNALETSPGVNIMELFGGAFSDGTGFTDANGKTFLCYGSPHPDNRLVFFGAKELNASDVAVKEYTPLDLSVAHAITDGGIVLKYAAHYNATSHGSYLTPLMPDGVSVSFQASVRPIPTEADDNWQSVMFLDRSTHGMPGTAANGVGVWLYEWAGNRIRVNVVKYTYTGGEGGAFSFYATNVELPEPCLTAANSLQLKKVSGAWKLYFGTKLLDYPIEENFIDANGNTFVCFGQHNNSSLKVFDIKSAPFSGTITVKDETGAGITDATVTLSGATVTNNNDGTYSYSNLDVNKEYALSISKNGYSTETATIKSSARNVTKTIYQIFNITATVTGDGTTLGAGTTVYYSINGGAETSSTTNASGQFILENQSGSVAITALRVAGYNAVTTTSFTLNAASKTFTVAATGKLYNGSITIKDEDNTAIGAGVSVNYTLNGTSKSGATDASGKIYINDIYGENTVVITGVTGYNVPGGASATLTITNAEHNISIQSFYLVAFAIKEDNTSIGTGINVKYKMNDGTELSKATTAGGLIRFDDLYGAVKIEITGVTGYNITNLTKNVTKVNDGETFDVAAQKIYNAVITLKEGSDALGAVSVKYKINDGSVQTVQTSASGQITIENIYGQNTVEITEVTGYTVVSGNLTVTKSANAQDVSVTENYTLTITVKEGSTAVGAGIAVVYKVDNGANANAQTDADGKFTVALSGAQTVTVVSVTGYNSLSGGTINATKAAKAADVTVSEKLYNISITIAVGGTNLAGATVEIYSGSTLVGTATEASGVYTYSGLYTDVTLKAVKEGYTIADKNVTAGTTTVSMSGTKNAVPDESGCKSAFDVSSIAIFVLMLFAGAALLKLRTKKER